MIDLFKFLPAMEADDITDEVQTNTEKALGKTSSTEDSTDNNMMKTDDILNGSQSEKGGNEDSPDEVNDISDDDSEIDDDESLYDNNEVNDEDNPDDNTDDNTDNLDDDLNDEPATILDNEVEMRKNLINNMIVLHNIISNNIDLLADYSSQVTSNSSSKVLYNITSNLNECKAKLFKTITDDFGVKDYVDLVKIYTGINQVYNISIDMLNKYFDDLQLQTSPTHVKHKKKISSGAKK